MAITLQRLKRKSRVRCSGIAKHRFVVAYKPLWMLREREKNL